MQKKKPPLNKLFVVRKYIFAKDAEEAIKKEKGQPVEDVWIDEDFKKGQGKLSNAIGFNVEDGTYDS